MYYIYIYLYIFSICFAVINVGKRQSKLLPNGRLKGRFNAN